MQRVASVVKNEHKYADLVTLHRKCRCFDRRLVSEESDVGWLSLEKYYQGTVILYLEGEGYHQSCPAHFEARMIVRSIVLLYMT